MKPLVDKKVVLEKMQGKGGWTFARIPGLTRSKNVPFGWKMVKGTIDGYPIDKYHLMPIANGNGAMFLAVRAEIRKKIGKSEGDTIHVVLYEDHDPLEIPEEFSECLEDEPKALEFFNSLTISERKYYIQWIYSAKHYDTKVRRITMTINRLVQGLKRYETAKSEF